METTRLYPYIISLLILSACEVENPVPDTGVIAEYANWLIPKNQLIIKKTAEDLEPPLQNPDFIQASEVTYLDPDDHVLGVRIDGTMRAYPVRILNYHEVINDLFQQHEVMISYDPLTGTAAAWDRGNLKGFSSSYKSSIYVYNSHHILVDEETHSHWLPMQFECVNGALEGFDPVIFPIIETTWNTWLSMFPGSKILSDKTGYSHDYTRDPYENYRINDSIRFYTDPIDRRLPLKEQVHGIVVNDRVKIYSSSLFGDTTSIIQDNFQGLSVVVIGNNSRKFILSYERRVHSGIELEFFPVNNDTPNIIMKDNSGNLYDLFGHAIVGPDKGRQLTPTRSLFGYWFAMAAIYPGPIINQ